MNIFFVAAAVDKAKTPPTYLGIIEAAKKMHKTISYEHIFISSKKETPEQRYRSMIEQIKKSDVVIAEASSLTAEISRLISVSLQHHIPTLVLYQKQNPEMYVFESSRLLTLKQYTQKTVEEIIKKYFSQASRKQLRYRFNLMLSKEINMHVMDKSKDNKMSKADYVRKLILADMDKGNS